MSSPTNAVMVGPPAKTCTNQNTTLPEIPATSHAPMRRVIIPPARSSAADAPRCEELSPLSAPGEVGLQLQRIGDLRHRVEALDDLERLRQPLLREPESSSLAQVEV